MQLDVPKVDTSLVAMPVYLFVKQCEMIRDKTIKKVGGGQLGVPLVHTGICRSIAAFDQNLSKIDGEPVMVASPVE